MNLRSTIDFDFGLISSRLVRLFVLFYLKICINMSRDNKLGFRFVLAVDHVHLELFLRLLEQVAKIHGIFDAFLEVFGEVTTIT